MQFFLRKVIFRFITISALSIPVLRKLIVQIFWF